MFQIRDNKEKRIIARFTTQADAEEYLRWKRTHVIEEDLEEGSGVLVDQAVSRFEMVET